MSRDWDGKERRRMSDTSDHDLLLRIDEKLTSFLSNFDKHVKDDETNFKELDQRATRLERGYWIVIGCILLAQFILNHIK